MYRVPIEVHNRLQAGRIPLVYVIITTHLGDRVYAERELSGLFGLAGSILYADGTYLADGSQLAGAGGVGVLEKSGRLLSAGPFERSVVPRKDDVMTAVSSKQKQHCSVELLNGDDYFAKLIPTEPFLGRTMAAYVGFDDLPQGSHLKVFEGKITENTISNDWTFTIEVDEQ